MKFNNENRYEHQFAVGTTLLGGIGYSVPLGKRKRYALNIEFEADYSSRNGDVTGVGEDQTFENSHVSINFGLGF